MCSSGVFVYETEESEIAYLIVHVENPPNLENETNFFYPEITTSESTISTKNLPNSDTTYAFTIDMTTGGVIFYGIPNVDLFPSPTKAWEKLSSMHKMKVGMPHFLGTHLIGLTVEGNSCYILTVEEKEEVAVIFDQPIYRIKKVNTYTISWEQTGVYSDSTAQSKYNKSSYIAKPEFLDFEIRKSHFFCPTLDLSSPFPYPKNEINHNVFCWNKRFIRIFEEVGAFQCCIVLLQGIVLSMNDCRTCTTDNIIFVMKRSSSNPGTRYLARGLSEDDQEPANECECELIFVNEKTRYFSHAWRRGSPPIFWGTDANLFTQKNTVNKKANESNSYAKTHVYFLQDIFVRFDVKRCNVFSFLKNDGTEKDINAAYEASVEAVNQNFSHIAPQSNQQTEGGHNYLFNISFTRFFFDNFQKGNVVEYFIEQIMNDIQSVHFNHINFTEYNKDEKKYTFYDHQDTVYRFNCADSLDRTNVGSFAFGIILTSKFASSVGVSLRRSSTNAAWFEPFKYLKPSVINFLCRAFTKSGNIVSKMYSNTEANRNALIKQFYMPENDEEDFKVKNDVVNIFWRNINSIMFDKKRQNLIFQWLDTEDFRRKRAALDRQHIGFYQFITHEASRMINNDADEEENQNEKKSLSNDVIYLKNDEGLNLVDESVLSDTERCFVLSTTNIPTNEVCVVFPEPVVVCAISFLVIPQTQILKTPTFDLFISDQLPERETYISGYRSTFMHGISLPIFIDSSGYSEKKWVTYDLLQIAKNSSQYPLDPETLRLARYAKIRFHMYSGTRSKTYDISNIKFSVKVPSQPKTLLYLKGQPPNLDVIEDIYKTKLDINSDLYMENLLKVEKNRIEKGINNYHRNNILVTRGINPWIYDFPSQFLKKKNDKKCLVCKSRFTDKNRPLYFISHKLMPQFFIEYNDFIRKYSVCINIDENSSVGDNTQKIIEMMGVKYVKVCQKCKDKLIILNSEEEKALIDSVFVKVDVTKEKLIRNFKAFPLIKSERNHDFLIDDFTYTINSNHARIFNAPLGIVTENKDKDQIFKQIQKLNQCLSKDSDIRIKSKKIVVGISFISYFHPNKITVNLNQIFKPQNQAKLKVAILMKIHDVDKNRYIEKIAPNSENNLEYAFDDFPERPIKFFDLIIEDLTTMYESRNDKKNEIDISIKRIQIHGKFELLNNHSYPYQNDHKNINLDQKLFPVSMPKFSDNKNILGPKVFGFDEQTRTQKIQIDQSIKYNALIFKPFRGIDKNEKVLPTSMIIAYYDNSDNIMYIESLIIPNWIGKFNSTNFSASSLSSLENDADDQFVFPLKDTVNAKYILIFYLDRLKIIIPYRIILAKI